MLLQEPCHLLQIYGRNRLVLIIRANRQSTDVDFTKTMGIKILQGKDFSGTPSDTSAMLLNKAAVVAMGLKHPVGIQMRYGNNNPFTVIGVTDNVIMGSPFEPVDPMMVSFLPNNSNSISIRLNQSVLP